MKRKLIEFDGLILQIFFALFLINDFQVRFIDFC